jgi:hypothetical protein
MSDPEFDKNDPVWKALDAFKGIEPDPQSRARFWAKVARAETQASAAHTSGLRWFARVILPAAGFACAVIALAIGGRSLIRQHETDREIASNLELYEDLEVIRDIPQLASYEEPDDEETLQ